MAIVHQVVHGPLRLLRAAGPLLLWGRQGLLLHLLLQEVLARV
jgi:hypothetical protein